MQSSVSSDKNYISEFAKNHQIIGAVIITGVEVKNHQHNVL